MVYFLPHQPELVQSILESDKGTGSLRPSYLRENAQERIEGLPQRIWHWFRPAKTSSVQSKSSNVIELPQRGKPTAQDEHKKAA